MKTSEAYKNADWDLVDASKEEEFDISKVDDSQLPAELKGKTTEEKKRYIQKKKEEREEVVKQINDLNSKRTAYIAEKTKNASPDETSLDAVIIKWVRKQAAMKNFVFDNN